MGERVRDRWLRGTRDSKITLPRYFLMFVLFFILFYFIFCLLFIIIFKNFVF
jgi:hypothetical protein